MRGLLGGLGVVATAAVGFRVWLASYEDEVGLPAHSPWLRARERPPLLLAEGGLATEAPAHSLAAIRAAARRELDGVRLTIRVEPGRGPVLRAADGVRPHLAEALEAAGPELLVVLRLELPTRWRDPEGAGAAVALVAAARRPRGRTVLISPNPRALRSAHSAAPDLPVGFAWTPEPPVGGVLASTLMRQGVPSLPLRAAASEIPPHLATRAVVRAYQSRHIAVGVATLFRHDADTVEILEDAEHFWALHALGVDWVVAEEPERALAAL